MSTECAIESPFALISLPRPFDSQTGRTFAEPVYGYKAQKRRKRPEVVASVDGEGLQLYNVQTPRLITSYALPPQSTFHCPPASVYWRGISGSASQRLTYAAVSGQTTKHVEIIAFFEDVHRNATLDIHAKGHEKKSFKFPSGVGKVTAILPVLVSEKADQATEGFDICIVFASGSVTCISADLSKQRWQVGNDVSSLANSNTSDSRQVEFASIVSFESAKRGLFKGREDVLSAIIESSSSASPDRQSLLVLITASQKKRRTLKALALPNRTQDDISLLHQEPREVMSYRLHRQNVADDMERGEATYWLQASNGKLFQLCAGYVNVYDLSTTIPEASLSFGNADIDMCIPTSQTTILTCEKGKSSIYDTTYGSIQTELRMSPDESSTGKKRKHADESASLKDSTFVSHWSEIGLAVAVRSGTLIGMQVNINTSGRKRVRTGKCLLADALGKGRSATTEASDREIEQWKSKVDELVQSSDIKALEKLLAADLGITTELATTTDELHFDDLVNGTGATANGTAVSSQTLVWRFPKDPSALILRTDRRKALYCLKKMFNISEKPNGKRCLSVSLYAPNMIKWLALTGYISSAPIRQTLSDNMDATIVQPGSLVSAMTEMDPSLGMMHELFNWPIHVELEEVVEGLKAAIQSLDNPPAAVDEQMLLADGDEMEVVEESDQDIAIESQAAEEDLAFALASLDDGLAIRSLVLRAIFDRLYSFPASRVVSAFRQILSQKEIVFLITLLRIELADGGWTIRYNDEPEDDDKLDGPSDKSITVISSLLNSAVDAVGTSGWLVGLSGDKQLSTDEMLLILRAEASAALEGCYEANTLSVVLNDFEKYSQRAKELETPRRRKVDALRNPGFLAQDELEDPALPLGFKSDRIERTRTTKGGEVKVKSKGAIGKEISMRVGKYSIDRIRV